MPKRAIDLTIGDYYHIYNRAVAKNQLFTEKHNYWFFISKVKKYILDSTDVLAYCLMPNHYHFLVKLTQLNLPASMQRLAMSYTASFNKVYKRSGHLFQGRYQLRFIGKLDYLVQAVNYIHLNPFRAGLVKSPDEWEMSSYLEYIGGRNVDFIDCSVVLDLFGSGNDPSYVENMVNYKKHIEDNLID